jgi:broad specificity phosphatase PhoE
VGAVLTTVWLVRHGETRSYSSDSGLTPLGVEQAYRRGVDLADGVGTEPLRILTASSSRARATAEELRRGLLDQLPGRRGEIPEPEAGPEFDNFRITTPRGQQEITAAFAEYTAARERHDRHGTGPYPGWLVEIERFWAMQQDGGDPIRFWLTVPLLHFEPPSLCVRRFWLGIRRMLPEPPPVHVVVATHSGPMRAFATAALGRDAGEPDNAEAVVVRVKAGGTIATVAYRGCSHDVRLPDVASLPAWTASPPVPPDGSAGEVGTGPPRLHR